MNKFNIVSEYNTHIKNRTKSDEKVKIVVADEKRITSNILQIEEMQECIGIRISQIENGSPIFTDIGDLGDLKSIAIKELLDRKNPLIVERPIGEKDNYIIVEQWAVIDMTYAFINYDILEEQKIANIRYNRIFNINVDKFN